MPLPRWLGLLGRATVGECFLWTDEFGEYCQVFCEFVHADGDRRHGLNVTIDLAFHGVVSAIAMVSQLANLDRTLSDLRQVAPTVAVGRDPAAVVLDALRRAGYAPVPDPAPNAGNADDPVITVRRAPGPRPAAVTAVTADGIVETIDLDASRVDPSRLAARLYTAPVPNQQRVQALINRLRDADSGLGFARLPDEEVRLLVEAAMHGTAVWIKYESAFSTSGKGSWRLLDELHIDPRQVVAWCCTRQKQKAYPLYSIKSVEPA